jgi:hypothetical protein
MDGLQDLLVAVGQAQGRGINHPVVARQMLVVFWHTSIIEILPPNVSRGVRFELETESNEVLNITLYLLCRRNLFLRIKMAKRPLFNFFLDLIFCARHLS